MAQAAQCMPSKTTLDRQQPACWGSGTLNDDHSCGSSSKASSGADGLLPDARPRVVMGFEGAAVSVLSDGKPGKTWTGVMF
jgi:hypothetical protein